MHEQSDHMHSAVAAAENTQLGLGGPPVLSAMILGWYSDGKRFNDEWTALWTIHSSSRELYGWMVCGPSISKTKLRQNKLYTNIILTESQRHITTSSLWRKHLCENKAALDKVTSCYVRIIQLPSAKLFDHLRRTARPMLNSCKQCETKASTQAWHSLRSLGTMLQLSTLCTTTLLIRPPRKGFSRTWWRILPYPRFHSRYGTG